MRAQNGSSRLLPVIIVALLPVAIGAGERLGPLETEFALPGYFIAGSLRPEGSSGFATSANRPKRIDMSLPAGQLALIALPSQFALFRGQSGFRVFLANTTGSAIALEASDSRLSIVREAQDLSGQWRAVEYLPRSWCGNSYHHVSLPAGYYWSFTAPEYTGSFRTKMRFLLLRKDGPVYSNEFEGWINPSQFDNRKKHVPAGIMDPYLD